MWPIAASYGTERATPLASRDLAELARRQHGVVSLSQLRALRLSPRGARGRVAAGRLHPIHRGVYAVGHANLSPEGHWLAAILACGPPAWLSHRSAAALLDLRPTARRSVDVTSPRRAGRSRPGITAHGAATLHPDDTTTVRDIPSTTVARTLLDLADVVDRRALQRACERAEALRVLDLRAMTATLERAKGRHGQATLRRLLEDHDPTVALTRNELERRFLELCRAAGVPQPAVNARMTLNDGTALEVDFTWREQRLIVETDGFATHGTRGAFESDRSRDRLLLLAGWRVVRFTWRQITAAPTEVTRTLHALLIAETP